MELREDLGIALGQIDSLSYSRPEITPLGNLRDFLKGSSGGFNDSDCRSQGPVDQGIEC
jgi:hypothetical protein